MSNGEIKVGDRVELKGRRIGGVSITVTKVENGKATCTWIAEGKPPEIHDYPIDDLELVTDLGLV